MSELSQRNSFHELVENQRRYHLTGIPANLEHRNQQLTSLKKLLLDGSDVLTNAVYSDLRRWRRKKVSETNKFFSISTLENKACEKCPIYITVQYNAARPNFIMKFYASVSAMFCDFRALPKVTYSFELSTVLLEIDYMIDNLKKWSAPEPAEKTVLSILDTVAVLKEPLGVVLIIGPWNYPLCLNLLPVVAAIAAGNTVIVKPSEYAPHTAVAIYELFSRGFDQRFLAVVNGGVAETTNLLKERFDHIFYTGNPSVGKVIMTAAAQHLTPVTLELGGKSPVIVESDADLDLCTRRIAWGKWMNCGQTCLAPDYILIKDSLKPQLVNKFIERLKEFYGSEPQKSKDYSRIINEKHFDRLSNLLARSKGQILYQGGELNRDDLFIPPIIIAVSVDDVLMEDEIFGPILPIVTTSGFDESVDFIRFREKPLAAYLFTRSEKKVRQLCADTSSGSVTVNDVNLQYIIDTLPFGGVGQSGMGKYRGKYGFNTFSHHKAFLKRGFFGETLFAMRYPPFTDKKFEQLKMIMGRRRPLPSVLSGCFIGASSLIVGVIFGIFLQRFGMKY